ncbi:MAG: 2-hydroxyacyl-CoA dehydratase [Bacilli bacterium]|nr:2-hydroxyacyl-CoA dehydratase [Bacilli bacterium]
MVKVCFPVMGDYSVPVKYLLTHILKIEVMNPVPITQKTIELGSKYSPDFVCTPFKYTLGTFIECLEKGANVLVQAGGGCRYGYYGELQEQILKDLGYEFSYFNLVTEGVTKVGRIVKYFKNMDSSFKPIPALYYTFITSKMIKYMDKIDVYIRENIGFETEEGSFVGLKKKMLKKFSKVKNPLSLFLLYRKYKKEFKKIEINKPKHPIKVGIIGELYTVMEPNANYHLEYLLAQYGISIKRYTNVHYLVFEKKNAIRKYLRKTRDYIKYQMGADAADNIARAKYLCEHDYDGIIHIKSSFCTPEIGAMPIINKICKAHDVPLLYFSFDTASSEVGVQTRIEAFYDMIEMRRENEKRVSGH